jgi:polysaccharide export outer membrane protein
MSSRTKWSGLAALGLLLGACLAAPAAAVAAESDTADPLPVAAVSLVGAEDLIEISVFEIPDLNRTVRVSSRGTISLPLLGEIRVEGLTPMEVESRLRDELGRRYLQDPQVSVFVKEHGSSKVSVLGAVGKPGVYEMIGPRTLLQILSQAGGLTDDAAAELFLIRGANNGNTERIPIPVQDLMAHHDPALNVAIRSGDIISVPIEQEIYIYVDGAVKNPGRVEHPASRSITLLQAIAKAGGTTDRANLKEIQVLRKGEDGTQKVVQVNLKRIRKGKDLDPLLQDGDIVVVQETFF